MKGAKVKMRFFTGWYDPENELTGIRKEPRYKNDIRIRRKVRCACTNGVPRTMVGGKKRTEYIFDRDPRGVSFIPDCPVCDYGFYVIV